ncbi:GNAT family N-acetyltransferase [Geosporobacter ferrireducens]|uniref:N-acetyltransferase domain-containing protein n=1 Tax=Geosporobacter ferrireducens TaxID=1424294 RepID=A0A1D8GMV8_9FIRM|nr:GNAT family N-acetyltransferase [Geosporobacter ferrireducens]AOT72234.1 hypothetical protein Gferi_23425 [Geosporobacter ferrireducens]
MGRLSLVELSTKYSSGLKKMILDYEKYGEREYFVMYKEALDDFDKYVEKLQRREKGIGLPKEWGAYTALWLADEDNRILGGIRVRKELGSDFLRKIGGHIGYDISPSYRGKGYGKLILKLGLEKAAQMNISHVLITCQSDNFASMKIIETNGGIFESEIIDKASNRSIRRYWFNLDSR